MHEDTTDFGDYTPVEYANQRRPRDPRSTNDDLFDAFCHAEMLEEHARSPEGLIRVLIVAVIAWCAALVLTGAAL